MSTSEERRSAGIDVGAGELVVAIRGAKGGARIRRFGNAATGHRALVEWLVESQVTHVCVEASGIYSLDACLALHGAEGIDVMVANPRAVKSFAEALLARNKTDPDDATVLLAFAERMPFSAWNPRLDPRKVQSGTSLDKPPRISRRGNRYLRAALYMPALTLAHRDEHGHAFYAAMVGRGKRPMQATVAVMRKLLHVLHAMFRKDELWNGARAFRANAATAAPSAISSSEPSVPA